MKIGQNTLLFFDATCLIAAAGSPTGGSGFLLSLCARHLVKGAVSQPVLLEAERNIRSKLGIDALNRFYRFLIVIPFVLAPLPPTDELADMEKLVNEKDVHVVGAASAINATFLLTLDRGLAKEVQHANFKFQALSPGEFIKTVLPKHEAFPGMRN